MKNEPGHSFPRSCPPRFHAPDHPIAEQGHATFSVVVALAIAGFAVVLVRHHQPTGTQSPAAQQSHNHHGHGPLPTPINGVPTLNQLLNHFAVLRRQQTPADRSWKQASGSASPPFQRLLPRLTRLAATATNGDRVFLTVEKILRTPHSSVSSSRSRLLRIGISPSRGRGSAFDERGASDRDQ
jgi:hypothetical protein